MLSNLFVYSIWRNKFDSIIYDYGSASYRSLTVVGMSKVGSQAWDSYLPKSESLLQNFSIVEDEIWSPVWSGAD